MSLSGQVACRGCVEASAQPSETSDGTTGPPAPAETSAARRCAVHTPNFPALLRQLGASLLVTTYQAGKLVMVRDEGDHLNTHFRAFQPRWAWPCKAAGLPSAWPSRSGSSSTCRRSPRKLDPPGKHDACFLPRASHVTGNIQGHEMAWVEGNELWFVNTRFSCLCTRDTSASFPPRWRPPFVSALAPTDRCHLNGLGMVDGRPRYVTALGETNDRPDGGPTRPRAAS